MYIKMKLYSFVFTKNQTDGSSVQWEKQRLQDRALGGRQNKSLQRSEKVEPIYIDW